jgi:hypothetical protein
MTKRLFTLWARGKLLGEVAFDGDREEPCIRTGWLTPNDETTHLIPFATINPAAEALIAIGRLLKSVLSGEDHSGFNKLENSSEYADFASAMAEAESFNLELRRADGSVVRTERIRIMDTHRLIAGVEGDMEGIDEADAAFDDSLVAAAQSAMAEWESDVDISELFPSATDEEEEVLPRFQVYISLESASEMP